ncbi:ISL3 family transposase [Actinomadura algeriensis]|uniref:Transposase n=1 Tax=Actinomadura algeriensis TaxID=1679523 RepID=A0ABR9K2F5_9ACTN|nr:transposase [Actinomadura algeriensis]
MIKGGGLVDVVFSGLSGLVIDDVTDEGELIRVRARSRKAPVPCPECAVESAYVHGWCERTVADVPVDGRPVVLDVRVRRLACRDWRCPRRTFREQLPGLLERYQRRTVRLTAQVGAVVRELAGRAGARMLAVLGAPISRHTALRALLRIPLPVVATPQVLGVDDFCLRRSRTYATILIDAETRRRVDVLPDRRSDTLAAWLREHPGVQVVCRDGAAGYADAVHQALPDALQVGDRWHIWHNFAQAAGKEVAVHSGCWASASRLRRLDGGRTTTLARWQQVHELLDAGVGLLECARWLNLALNTVKRYARVDKPEQMRRAPQYRPTLVDLYREYLLKRRAEDPAVPVLQLLREIRERGYTGSQNLLYRYITQGRVEDDRPGLSPRRLARLLLARPDNLKPDQHELLAKTTSTCPEMSSLAALVRAFAQLLAPAANNGDRLHEWISAAEEANLPHVHSFIRGLRLDQDAVLAALTSEYHNGGTEGVNTRTKLIKRQMYGRAGFPLLRHRILLG